MPDDRKIVVERFRDELGDWRIAVHSPFGARVHAPWALAIEARLRERSGVDVQADGATTASCCAARGRRVAAPADRSCPRPGRDRGDGGRRGRRLGAVRGPVPGVRGPGPAAAPPRPGSAHAALAAAPAGRGPAGGGVASTGRSRSCWRPIRECLRDVFDLPALVGLMARHRPAAGPGGRGGDRRRRRRSPASLLFAYVARSCTRATPRWPSAGPRPSPSTGAAGRAARASRAARAARPRGPGRARGRAAGAADRRAGPATSRARPTCCAGWAR